MLRPWIRDHRTLRRSRGAQRRDRRHRTPLYLVVEKTGEAAEFVTDQLDDTGR